MWKLLDFFVFCPQNQTENPTFWKSEFLELQISRSPDVWKFWNSGIRKLWNSRFPDVWKFWNSEILKFWKSEILKILIFWKSEYFEILNFQISRCLEIRMLRGLVPGLHWAASAHTEMWKFKRIPWNCESGCRNIVRDCMEMLEFQIEQTCVEWYRVVNDCIGSYRAVSVRKRLLSVVQN